MVYIRMYICTYIRMYIRTLRSYQCKRTHLRYITSYPVFAGLVAKYKACYVWAARCHHRTCGWHIYYNTQPEMCLLAQLTRLRIPSRVVCLLLLGIWLEECTYIHMCIQIYKWNHSMPRTHMKTLQTNTQCSSRLFVCMCLKLCESVRATKLEFLLCIRLTSLLTSVTLYRLVDMAVTWGSVGWEWWTSERHKSHTYVRMYMCEKFHELPCCWKLYSTYLRSCPSHTYIYYALNHTNAYTSRCCYKWTYKCTYMHDLCCLFHGVIVNMT